MKSIIAEIFSLVSAYHQQSEYAAGFQAALNDAAHYILTHHNQPMDNTLWLANTYNRVHFQDGLLAAIENQWTDIRRIQWDLTCMTSPILDEQY